MIAFFIKINMIISLFIRLLYHEVLIIPLNVKNFNPFYKDTTTFSRKIIRWIRKSFIRRVPQNSGFVDTMSDLDVPELRADILEKMAPKENTIKVRVSNDIKKDIETIIGIKGSPYSSKSDFIRDAILRSLYANYEYSVQSKEHDFEDQSEDLINFMNNLLEKKLNLIKNLEEID